jgi:DNA-binding transcriptional ArsR family regulator
MDELFEILSNGHRRRVLVALRDHNPQDEDEITSASVAGEDDGSDEALDRLRTELNHIHLPKLNDAGFVDWDPDSGTITRGPRDEEVEPLLELMDEHADELPDDWP